MTKEMSHTKSSKDKEEIELLINSLDDNRNDVERDKRRMKLSKSENGEDNHVGLPINGKSITEGLDKTKNNRKPRNGKGRGLPKKGGGGGKGTWGKLGVEYPAEGDYLDKNDPNYDSESSEDVVADVLMPEISQAEFTRRVEPIIKEYFNHGDSQEVLDLLRELNLGQPLKPELAYMAVSMALDHKDDDKELTSVLLADLNNYLITQDDIEQAFAKMLCSLPDLVIDIPEAPTVIGTFIARAIADDCLDPESVTRFHNIAFSGTEEQNHLPKCAIARTEYLLSINTPTEDNGCDVKRRRVHLPGMDLHTIWGKTGSYRPVKTLTKAMEASLKEYARTSNDIPEAGRSLLELHVPHFHHEYVFLAICLAIEDGTKRTAVRIRDLLETLLDQGILDATAIEKGFERAIDYLPEMCLDVPKAHSLLEKFVSMCCTNDDDVISECDGNHKKNIDVFVEVGQGDDKDGKFHNGIRPPVISNGSGDDKKSHVKHQHVVKSRNRVRSGCFTSIITKDILSKLPNKGRKRFVSEGDGGLFKNSDDIDPFK